MFLFKEVFRPVFPYTPTSCLAAIVTFSVFKIYSHFDGLKKLMTIDRLDALVWLVATLSVIFFDVTLGLSTGLICCIFSVVIRSQLAESTVLARLGDTEIYADSVKYCRNSYELQGIKIIKFLSPLHYINTERFRDEITRLSGRDLKTNTFQQPLHAIILDCSCISYVDYGGIKELAEVMFQGGSKYAIDFEFWILTFLHTKFKILGILKFLDFDFYKLNESILLTALFFPFFQSTVPKFRSQILFIQRT